jgi:hypothetical protein
VIVTNLLVKTLALAGDCARAAAAGARVAAPKVEVEIGDLATSARLRPGMDVGQRLPHRAPVHRVRTETRPARTENANDRSCFLTRW